MPVCDGGFGKAARKGMSVQNKNVNVAAMTERATPACAARIDTPTTSPPAELLLLVPLVETGVLDEVSGVDKVGDEELSPVLEVVAVEDTEVVFVDDVGLVLLLLTPRYDGAGTAEAGLESAPVPHAISSPSGWVAFGGGTVAPVESAMANRPVHERFEDKAEVNW